jgi:hypothetical protein
MPATTETSPLEQLTELLYSYPESRLRNYKRGLIFTESGLARASSIAGYIVGMAHGGNEAFANQLADDFLKNLDRLVPEHEIDVEYKGQTLKTPASVCQLFDDGSLHGFSLGWYRFNRILPYGEKPAERCITLGHYPVFEYTYSYNGGLIYHGPKAGQTFTVTINPCLWGIHT